MYVIVIIVEHAISVIERYLTRAQSGATGGGSLYFSIMDLQRWLS
jgi:hypothetical protein